jgi:hypothetical protein
MEYLGVFAFHYSYYSRARPSAKTASFCAPSSSSVSDVCSLALGLYVTQEGYGLFKEQPGQKQRLHDWNGQVSLKNRTIGFARLGDYGFGRELEKIMLLGPCAG